MTYLDFIEICCEACVLPSVAFENPKIAQAFAVGDHYLVQKLVNEEF